MAHVNGEIARALKGAEASEQEAIDRDMIDLDGTPNKGRLVRMRFWGIDGRRTGVRRERQTATLSLPAQPRDLFAADPHGERRERRGARGRSTERRKRAGMGIMLFS